MAELTLTADQVGNVLAQVPLPARTDPRLFYAAGVLHVPEDIAAPFVAANPATPAPVPSATVDFLAFDGLFTPAEHAAIYASADWQIKRFLTMAAGAYDGVNLGDARVVGGLAYLVSIGILTNERVAAIVANQPPA